MSAAGPSPLLVVLSGPSGVGKDAVLSRMRELGAPFYFTVTATTRPRRAGETDGVDYIFVSRKRFEEMAEGGQLLESAEVYGNLYGVPREQAVTALRQGRDVILKIDVQGATTIRKVAPEAVFIFLAAPDMDELARRLTRRMSESEEALRVRLATAALEMEEMSKFEFVVTNHSGRLDDTVREIESIVTRERVRVPPRAFPLGP